MDLGNERFLQELRVHDVQETEKKRSLTSSCLLEHFPCSGKQPLFLGQFAGHTVSRKIDILQFYNPNLPLIPPSSEPSFRPIMGKLSQPLFSRSSVRLHSFLKRLSIISHLLSRCVVMSSTLEIQASACGLALTEIFSLVVVSLIVDRSTGRPAQNSIYTGHLCK